MMIKHLALQSLLIQLADRLFQLNIILFLIQDQIMMLQKYKLIPFNPKS